MRNISRISRKAWRRSVDVLLWYPDNVEEYNEILEELMARDPEAGADAAKPLCSDPTASAAVRLASNKRARVLSEEIEAVEEALRTLTPEQRIVVERRFFSSRQAYGRRKPRQYDYLQDLGYSLDGMRKIVRGVIVRVAGYLGEK